MKQLKNYFIFVSSWLIFTIAETKWAITFGLKNNKFLFWHFNRRFNRSMLQ